MNLGRWQSILLNSICKQYLQNNLKIFSDLKERKESYSVSALCKHVGYVFVFITSARFCKHFLELVSRLKR